MHISVCSSSTSGASGSVRRFVYVELPAELGSVSEGELRACVRSLRGARAELDAHQLHVAQELSRREAVSPSFKAVEVLKTDGGLPGPAAKRQTVLAEQSVHFPAAVEALASGRLTEGHLQHLARASEAHPRAFAADVDELTDLACNTSVELFGRHVSRWIVANDSDDGDERFEEQHRRRHLTFRTNGDGTVALNGVFDPESGSTIQGAVTNLARDMLRAEGEGRRPETTGGQRMADALTHLAIAGTAVDYGSEADGDLIPARPARVLLHVRCDADVLTGDLERARQRGAHVGDTSLGVALSAATIRRLACDAGVIPTVLGGDSQILDVGRMRRTATAAQRSALEHRDGHCVFPGCDRPPGWCQVHHLIPWKTGGSTNLDNLVMLCGTHHHMLHEGRWKLRRDSSGWVAIPPGDRPGSGGANAAGGLGGALPSNVAADTPADGTCSDGDRPLGLAGVDDALARGRPARRVEKPGSPGERSVGW